MSVPDATFELRSRQTSLLSDRQRSPNGAPFAAVKLVGASLAVVRSEQYVTKLKLGLSSLVVEDLFEKAGSCLLRTVFESDRLAPLVSVGACWLTRQLLGLTLEIMPRDLYLNVIEVFL